LCKYKKSQRLKKHKFSVVNAAAKAKKLETKRDSMPLGVYNENVLPLQPLKIYKSKKYAYSESDL
jgi:hypothetical protein